MKSTLIFPLILVLSCIGQAHASNSKALKVIIDPGHGGRDNGAVHGHMKESEVTLKVSEKLKQLLQKDPRFKTQLTRSENLSLSLADRAQFAVEEKGDLFLSIHANSSTDPRAKGLEIYFQNQLPPDEEAMYMAARENGAVLDERQFDIESTTEIPDREKLSPEVRTILADTLKNDRIRRSSRLSSFIREHWKGQARAPGLSLRQAPFFVISHVNMPSALIEIGYLTNPREGKLLLTDEYQEKVAQSIHKALIKYKEELDKSKQASLD